MQATTKHSPQRPPLINIMSQRTENLAGLGARVPYHNAELQKVLEDGRHLLNIRSTTARSEAIWEVIR